MTRAMSRMTPRALSWWKVAIWPTCSGPYFSWTYLMTSSRRFMQKSTSKSGIDTRSGLRKRSNSSLNGIGSMSVMRRANATSEPAPEPRPGPTGMPWSLAQLDEVPDDQEVARELHLLDDVELGAEPGPVLVGVEGLAQRLLLGESLVQPLLDPLLQVAVGVLALGHLEVGQARVAEVELDVAAAGDVDRVLERLGARRRRPRPSRRRS